MSNPRHKRKRLARCRLKADAWELFDRLASEVGCYQAEIAEMKLRLKPEPGKVSPVILTGYTSKEDNHENS